MSSRSKNGYDTFIDNFTNLSYVICPKCRNQAIIEVSPMTAELIMLTCSHCGFTKEKQTDQYTLGTSSDPFFALPLWLTAQCGDDQLWAYNYEHLRFLREHIEARLRERNGLATHNQSLGSRLPKWILTKKHRESVIKVIKQLEKMQQNG